MTLPPRSARTALLPRLILLVGSVAIVRAAPAFDSVAETEKYLAMLPAEAREPDDFATTALKPSEGPKPGTGRREEIIFFDHSSGHQRILMAMRWKAEHLMEVHAAPSTHP